MLQAVRNAYGIVITGHASSKSALTVIEQKTANLCGEGNFTVMEEGHYEKRLALSKCNSVRTRSYGSATNANRKQTLHTMQSSQ